jgi:uncharacterized caspase-like protein
LRQAFHDFHDKVAQSGPNTVAMIYLNGYALQFEGDNYFVPVDANIHTANDVPAEAVRISDYTNSIVGLGTKAEIVVVDGARQNPFQISGQPLASGLSLSEAQPGMLVAYNASPGTVAPTEQGPYGAYAKSLAEMIRQGGLQVNQVFEQTNLRVNEQTQGAEVSWDDSKISTPFEFFELNAKAPPPAVSNERMVALETQPIKSFSANDAYAAAIERGTLQGYLDFLAAYPDDPMAHRIRAILAARREAEVWHHTWRVNTPAAYWSYLRRYPKGPHIWDARRRLRELAAAYDPPPVFEEIEYDVPPPPLEEVIIVERPVIYFGDFDYAPPPPPPVYFLPPPPPAFYRLPPPPPPSVDFFLPIPVFIPVPVWVDHPHNVAPPPPNGPNIYYQNIHNTVTINVDSNDVKITNAKGENLPPPPLPPQTEGQQPNSALPLLAPSLPGSLAKHLASPITKQSTPPSQTNGVPPAAAPDKGAFQKLPDPNQLPVVNTPPEKKPAVPTPPMSTGGTTGQQPVSPTPNSAAAPLPPKSNPGATPVGQLKDAKTPKQNPIPGTQQPQSGKPLPLPDTAALPKGAPLPQTDQAQVPKNPQKQDQQHSLPTIVSAPKAPTDKLPVIAQPLPKVSQQALPKPKDLNPPPPKPMVQENPPPLVPPADHKQVQLPKAPHPAEGQPPKPPGEQVKQNPNGVDEHGCKHGQKFVNGHCE